MPITTAAIGAAAQAAPKMQENILKFVDKIFFGNKLEKKKAEAEIRLKEQKLKYDQSLSTLTNQQKYVLDMQLANAKTDTERMALIANAVAQINQTSVAANASAGYKTAMIVLGSSVVLIGGLYLLSKD